jgi:2-C-methyl-D-erythritol 4-phosphate cytidylyltransferase
MSAALVVPAAGRGARLGGREEKALILLGGRPILAWTLLAFDEVEEIEERVVLVPPGREAVSRERVLGAVTLRHPVTWTAGGEERQDSVRLGLAALRSEAGTVLVHDAARPLAGPALIRRVIGRLEQEEAVIPALRPRDSIARRGSGGDVTHYEDRERLLAVQTPQGFHRSVLAEAFRRAEVDGVHGTDEASLVLRAGYNVTWTEGEARNVKITYPEDLAVAAALLGAEAEAS